MDTLKQFNLAMEYIEAHLAEDIDFEMVARLACCSEYHFRRMFASLAGLNLSDYIRRRRLSQALLELHHSDVRVVDLAIKYGYGSPDAFSRAFQALHGVTPTEVRAKEVSLRAFPPMSFQLTVRGSDPMEYRIVEKPAFSLMGICERISTWYSGLNPEIDALWNRLSEADIAELEDLSDAEPYGVLNAFPIPEGELRKEGLIDYWVGIATTQTTSSRWKVMSVSPSTWSIFTLRGPLLQALNEAWLRIYGEWMPTSNYVSNQRPHLLWTEHEDVESADFSCELWIPITKNMRRK